MIAICLTPGCKGVPGRRGLALQNETTMAIGENVWNIRAFLGGGAFGHAFEAVCQQTNLDDDPCPDAGSACVLKVRSWSACSAPFCAERPCAHESV